MSIIIDRSDGLSAATAYKGPCRAATTANITLSGEQTIDAISIVADDRVLVKDQTDQTANGIYVASASAWARAKDFKNNNDVITGTKVHVTSGTVSALREYTVTTADPVVIGTSNITFALADDVASTAADVITAAASAAAAQVAEISWVADGWQTSTAYTSSEPRQALANNGTSYICILDHTSGASSEPGTGGSWATYWEVLAEKGADGAGDLSSSDIGVTVQAYDAELAAIAGLTSAADKLPYFTGSGTADVATITAAARTVLDDASVSAMRSTLGVAIGSDVQAFNVNLNNSREMLISTRNYYVRTDGSDSNNGLTDSAGGAFLTIQKAFDTITDTLDTGGQNILINVGGGTYTSGMYLTKTWMGGGAIYLIGDTVTPSNVILDITSGQIFHWICALGGPLEFSGFRFQTTTSGDAIRAEGPGRFSWHSCEFGAIAWWGVTVDAAGAKGYAAGNYTINGNAGFGHINNQAPSQVNLEGKTITLTGTPDWGLTGFIKGSGTSMTTIYGNTFVGSATGKQYTMSQNSICSTAGTETMPGDTAGTEASGGQFL